MTRIDFDWAFHNKHLWECSPQDVFENHRNSECRSVHYGTPWPPGDPDVWPFWTDALGQQFQAGDLLAVSTISGRSPVLIVAECVRINRRRKNKELFRSGGYNTYDSPTGGLPPGMDYYSPNKPKTVQMASCTVTAKPIYSRFGIIMPYLGHKVRDSTYRFTENIVLLDPSAANIVRAEMAAAAAAAASANNPI